MFRILKKAAIVAMFVGLGSTALALDVDSGGVYTAGGAVNSSGGNNNTVWTDGTSRDIDLNGTTTTVVGGAGSNTVDIYVNAIYNNNGGGASLSIESTDQGATTGTIVRVGDFWPKSGAPNAPINITIGNSASIADRNMFIVENIAGVATTGTNISVGQDSLLWFDKAAGTRLDGAAANNFTINLQNGELQSTDGLTLGTATITGSGKIATDVTLDGPSAILSATGDTQDYKDVVVTAAGGQILVAGDATGAATMNIKTLDITGGINQIAKVEGTAANAGALNVSDLKMNAGAEINVADYGVLKVTNTLDFNDPNAHLKLSGGKADLSSLSGPLAMGGNGYILAQGGTNNSVLAVNADGVSLDAPNTLRVDDGSKLDVVVGSGTTPNGKVILNANQGIKLGTAAGNAELSLGNLVVTNAVNGDMYNSAGIANNTVNATNLTVQAGAVSTDNANVATIVTNSALIQGEHKIAGTASVFESGALVSGTGAKLTNSGAATLTTGTASKGGNITIANGAALEGDGTPFTIANAHTDPSDIFFTGSANSTAGTVIAADHNLKVASDLTLNVGGDLQGFAYYQTKGAVTGSGRVTALDAATVSVISGSDSSFAGSGTFNGGLNVMNKATLVGSGNTLAGGGAGTNLNMSGGSTIDLSADSMRATNFDTVNIDSMLIGYNAGMTKLDANTGVTKVNFNTGNLELTQDLSVELHNGSIAPTTHFIDGAMDAGSAVVKNIFGTFTFESGATGYWLADAQATDLNNTSAIKAQLKPTWGRNVISDGLAAGMGEMAKDLANGGTGIHQNTPAGNLNSSVLGAIMNGNSTWSSGGISGSAGRSMLAMYNGESLAGVNYVAEDVSREVLGTLHSRLDAYRKVRECVDVADTGAITIYDTVATRYLNRFWGGGLGIYQEADKRQNLSGYKYEGAGAILGYDRAFGPAVFGLAASYIEGDYEDKSAQHNNSKLYHYSGNAYMTYNASNGFYFSLLGGYTYSDNELRERRGGHLAKRDFESHTYNASGRMGFDFEPTSNLVITPSVGVDFFYSKSTANSVKYADLGKVIRYGAATHNAVEVPADIKVAYEVNMSEKSSLQLAVNAGYAYNVNDHGVRASIDLIDAGIPRYTSVGRKLGHHSWHAGAGVKLKIDRFDVGVKYDYLGRSKYQAHRVIGNIGYSF